MTAAVRIAGLHPRCWAAKVIKQEIKLKHRSLKEKRIKSHIT